MMPQCHECGYQFSEGEDAWAEDWKVIDVKEDGVTAVHVETRYTCDPCEGKA